MDVTRNSVFQESTRSLDQVNVRVAADMHGSATWVALNWGYVAEFGSWTLSPRLGILSSRSAVDAYTEEDVNNSGLAMLVNQVERNSLLGQISLGLSGSWSTESALFIPQMRIDFEHEFDTDAPATSARFLLDSGNTQYLLNAQERESDTLNVGVGLLVILPNGWMPFVDYQILLGNSQRDSYRITAGLRKEI
jgi:outer membrane autotransporter protein